MKPQLTATIRTVTRAQGENDLIVEGIANNANVTDSYGTRFRFTNGCLEASGNPIILWNHDANRPVGRAARMWKDDGGNLWLRAELQAHAEAPNGLTLGELVENGILNSFSIRFDEEATLERGKDFDLITPNRIDEVSVVTLPANKASTFSNTVRSILERLEGSEEGKVIVQTFRAEEPSNHAQNKLKEKGMKPRTVRKLPDLRTTRSGGPLNYSDLCSKIFDAVQDIAEEAGVYHYYVYPVAVHDDFVVVCWANDNEYTKHVYTVSPQGEVTVDPNGVDVLPTWTEIAETDTNADDPSRSMPNTTRAGAKFSKATLETMQGHISTMRSALDAMEGYMSDNNDGVEERSKKTPEATTRAEETPKQHTEPLPTASDWLSTLRGAFDSKIN